EGRVEEVEPQAIALERQSPAPRHDDPLVFLPFLSELDEDALEGAAVRRRAVEIQSQAGPGLAKGPRPDDVDYRCGGDPGQRPGETSVGAGQDEDVQENDSGRERGARGERGSEERHSPYLAASQGDGQAVGGDADTPDMD